MDEVVERKFNCTTLEVLPKCNMTVQCWAISHQTKMGMCCDRCIELQDHNTATFAWATSSNWSIISPKITLRPSGTKREERRPSLGVHGVGRQPWRCGQKVILLLKKTGHLYQTCLTLVLLPARRLCATHTPSQRTMLWDSGDLNLGHHDVLPRRTSRC